MARKDSYPISQKDEQAARALAYLYKKDPKLAKHNPLWAILLLYLLQPLGVLQDANKKPDKKEASDMNRLDKLFLIKIAFKKDKTTSEDIRKRISEKSWSMGSGSAAFLKSPISLSLIGGTISAKSKEIANALETKGALNKAKEAKKLLPAIAGVAGAQALINAGEGYAQKKFQHAYEPLLRKYYEYKYPHLKGKIKNKEE